MAGRVRGLGLGMAGRIGALGLLKVLLITLQLLTSNCKCFMP